MSINDTPSAERTHIGFFGLRNAGKSSLVNAVTGQDFSVVSPVKGTTTDSVTKTMELLPLGPVVITDTPGLDDQGELGSLRVEKARQALSRIHIAVVVTEALRELTDEEKELLELLRSRSIPTVLARNKCDLGAGAPVSSDLPAVTVSAKTGEGIQQLKELLGSLAPKAGAARVIFSDMVSPGDTVVLVTPIDSSAPKGRLILPQQLTLRELLDVHAIPILCQPEELASVLASLSRPPRAVITDSQVFGAVDRLVPPEIPLTSFSILMARYKGDLATQIGGAAKLSALKDGDRVLISEGCTHHRQCKDIGTVKLPGWIESFSGAKPEYTFTSGGDFPSELSDFELIVHCGGCMLNEKEMAARIGRAVEAGVPIVNYGLAIARMHGILRRSVELFPDVARLLDE